jgi:hypothetical protein
MALKTGASKGMRITRLNARYASPRRFSEKVRGVRAVYRVGSHVGVFFSRDARVAFSLHPISALAACGHQRKGVSHVCHQGRRCSSGDQGWECARRNNVERLRSFNPGSCR